MKNPFLIVIAASLVMAVHGFAQDATVALLATHSNPIRYTTDGTTLIYAPMGNPAMIPGYGQLNVALYAAAGGTTLNALSDGAPDLSAWTLGSPVRSQIAPLPGTFPAFLAGFGGLTANSLIQVEVVGWTGSFSSFQAALASGSSLTAWSGSTLSGGGFGWSFQSGDGITSAPIVTTGPGGFNGLVLSAQPAIAAVPEPSTIALGALGMAALLAFRRRRSRKIYRR